MEVMKYIGAAYILWLAIHIAFSRKTSENTEQSALFLKGFMLQFVNVKIYMFGVTALIQVCRKKPSRQSWSRGFRASLAAVQNNTFCPITCLSGRGHIDKNPVLKKAPDF